MIDALTVEKRLNNLSNKVTSTTLLLYWLYVFLPRYDDTLVVPIIENTPEEKDLKERMARAMEMYPDSCAVLVRRHGVYVWGETWEKAKTMWVWMWNAHIIAVFCV